MRPLSVFGVFIALVMLAACGGGSSSPITGAAAPTPGPTQTPATQNQRIGYAAGDDWEPYMTADAAGHLYVLYTHQNTGHLMLQRSDDDGKTWTAPAAVDSSGSTGQYDPWMGVDPVDGKTLWISYMEGSPAQQIRVEKSLDLGVTWSAPVAASGSLSHLDKDAMTVRGGTIAVCFDDSSTEYAAVSHDGGATWTQHAMTTFSQPPLQFLCSGAGIDSTGTIYFAMGKSDTAGTAASPAAEVWVERSTDGGTTWNNTSIDTGGAAYPCANCGAGAFFGSQMSLAVGSDDTIYLLWNANAPAADGSAERIYFARSSDHGLTYSARQDVSMAPPGVEHSFPTVLAGSTAGDVRIAYEDTRTGTWNVHYRTSASGGATWEPEQALSTGFVFPYGDYFRLALNPRGNVHAAWGESTAYTSAGNIWVY